MRVVSLYAKNYKWLARFLIVLVLYPVLNVSGWALGIILDVEGIQFNNSGFYILVFATLVIAATYPYKKHTSSYHRRKISDALLASISFCFIVLTGNHFSSGSQYQNINPAQASSQISIQTIEKPSKEKKKAAKKFLRNLVKKYKHAGDGEKALLIILTILVALIVVYLLAALSCSIACGGMEALAYVVFILGLGGIVFGVVKIIEKISRKSKKKKAEMQSS
jgi:hypothetical protein